MARYFVMVEEQDGSESGASEPAATKAEAIRIAKDAVRDGYPVAYVFTALIDSHNYRIDYHRDAVFTVRASTPA